MSMLKIREANSKGFAEWNVGGVADLSYPSSTTRRGRVQGNCPAIQANEKEVLYMEDEKIIQNKDEIHKVGVEIDGKIYRIRKLTERECWRLMSFSDEDFDKAANVNSRTQLYKQAGNSIVVNVLMAIFGQMIPGCEDKYKESFSDTTNV